MDTALNIATWFVSSAMLTVGVWMAKTGWSDGENRRLAIGSALVILAFIVWGAGYWLRIQLFR